MVEDVETQPDKVRCKCDFYVCTIERIDGDKGLYKPGCPFGELPNFEELSPEDQKATCGNCEFNKCDFSQVMKIALNVCSLWKSNVSKPEPEGGDH